MSLGLAACDPIGSARLDTSDTPVSGQDALVVSPATLDFGTISVLEDGFGRADFTITNAGDQTIAVHGHDEIISLEGDADLVFEVAADPVFELAAVPHLHDVWVGHLAHRLHLAEEALDHAGRIDQLE